MERVKHRNFEKR